MIYNCYKLEKVIFNTPSYLVTIKSSAFICCTALREINIQSSVTSIGSSCFNSYSNLIRVYLPKTLMDNKSSYGIKYNASVFQS